MLRLSAVFGFSPKCFGFLAVGPLLRVFAVLLFSLLSYAASADCGLLALTKDNAERFFAVGGIVSSIDPEFSVDTSIAEAFLFHDGHGLRCDWRGVDAVQTRAPFSTVGHCYDFGLSPSVVVVIRDEAFVHVLDCVARSLPRVATEIWFDRAFFLAGSDRPGGDVYVFWKLIPNLGTYTVVQFY